MPFFQEAKLAALELKSERLIRACMIIHSNDHIVLDTKTGVRYALSPEQAWAKLEELNCVDVAKRDTK